MSRAQFTHRELDALRMLSDQAREERAHNDPDKSAIDQPFELRVAIDALTREEWREVVFKLESLTWSGR